MHISCFCVHAEGQQLLHDSWFPRSVPLPHRINIKEGDFQRRASTLPCFFLLFLLMHRHFFPISFSSFVTKFLHSKESCFSKTSLTNSGWTLSSCWTSQELSIACVSQGFFFYYFFFYLEPQGIQLYRLHFYAIKVRQKPSAVKTRRSLQWRYESSQESSHRSKLIMKQSWKFCTSASPKNEAAEKTCSSGFNLYRLYIYIFFKKSRKKILHIPS